MVPVPKQPISPTQSANLVREAAFNFNAWQGLGIVMEIKLD
jgi:hypothetical protein